MTGGLANTAPWNNSKLKYGGLCILILLQYAAPNDAVCQRERLRRSERKQVSRLHRASLKCTGNQLKTDFSLKLDSSRHGEVRAVGKIMKFQCAAGLAVAKKYATVHKG